MSISTVKAGLDDIANSIRAERQAMKNGKARINTALNNLNAIPTLYAEVIAEIQSLGNDPSDLLYKDELVKMTAEFIALINSAQTGVTALSEITEY